MLVGIASGRNIQTNRRRDFKSNFLHGGLSGYYSLIFTDFFTNVLKYIGKKTDLLFTNFFFSEYK